MLAYASAGEQLDAGDVISTGTMPGCCGLELDRWIKPGQTVELEIDGIGTLTNRVSPTAVPATAGLTDADVLDLRPRARSGSCWRCCSATAACARSPFDASPSPTCCRARRSSTTRCCGSSSPSGSTTRCSRDAQVQPGGEHRHGRRAAGRGRPHPQRGRLGHPPLVSINQPAMERTMLAALEHGPSVDMRRG